MGTCVFCVGKLVIILRIKEGYSPLVMNRTTRGISFESWDVLFGLLFHSCERQVSLVYSRHWMKSHEWNFNFPQDIIHLSLIPVEVYLPKVSNEVEGDKFILRYELQKLSSDTSIIAKCVASKNVVSLQRKEDFPRGVSIRLFKRQALSKPSGTGRQSMTRGCDSFRFRPPNTSPLSFNAWLSYSRKTRNFVNF